MIEDTVSPATEIPEPPAVVPREVELKLFVPPSSAARLWSHPLLVAHAVGPLRVARIENRYFDTPGHELAQRRMALRLRRIGRRWLQTLKQSLADEGAMSARGEWEMPVAGPALEIGRLRDTPLATIAPVRSLARRLQPLFTTNFRRESRLLRLPDGSELEFAFDVGVIGTGRGRTRRSLAIREVEIEVKGSPDGATPDLMRFAARLCRDVALIPLAASKAARGYRLVDGAALEPERVVLPVPEASDHPAVYLSHVLTACNRALLVNVHALFELAAVDASMDARVEFVHQARVAVRRMRSALQTFRPVADGGRFDRLDARLTIMGKAFGTARDWDVFVTTTLARIADEVATDAVGRAALDSLRVDVAERRLDGHRGLMAYLDTGTFGETTIAVERIAARLAAGAGEKSGKGGKPLGERAPGWLSVQRDRVVRRSRRIAVLDQDERHGLRTEVKRMRYALDLLEALYEPRAVKRFGDALTEVQDKLGKLNDAVVADTLMLSFGEAEARTLIRSRFGAWLGRQVHKQLPKVAALSVGLELTPQPWAVPALKNPDPAEPVEAGEAVNDCG